MSWHWKVRQKLKENWHVAWKITYGIWLTFMQAVKSLKIYTLIGSFCPKQIKILIEKYGRFMFHDNEEWCKVWTKTDSWFQKWHEEFGQFSPNHSKVKKFHFDGLFLSKVYEAWAKKMQRSYLSWHWTLIQIWINPDLVVSKMA